MSRELPAGRERFFLFLTGKKKFGKNTRSIRLPGERTMNASARPADDNPDALPYLCRQCAL